jgi:hypothetical protein
MLNRRVKVRELEVCERESERCSAEGESGGVFVKEAISRELYVRGDAGDPFLAESDGRRRYSIFRCNYRVAIV